MNHTYTYTGKPIVPQYSLNIDGKVLEKDKDYDVVITDNINAGTASVTITGKGKFKGVIERSFEIEPVAASALSFFADSTEFEFDGTEKTMQLTIKFGEITLTEGIDYNVSYSDNVMPGKATALITLSGNYTGTINIDFEIVNHLPPLENLCELSADKIKLGDTVEVRSAAAGGFGEYLYAVYCKKSSDKKWVEIHGYNADQTASIKPGKAVPYNVCVKVKDEIGTVQKKYFDIEVDE